MALFRKLMTPDRQQTQLAYRVKFWPWHELSAAGRELVSGRSRTYMTIKQFEDLCDATKTVHTWKNREYRIVWAYNNMPTEAEWNKHDKSRLICCELRCSPAIPEYAVVILSFGLPSERLNAVAAGELSAGMDSEPQPLDSGLRRRHSDFTPLGRD